MEKESRQAQITKLGFKAYRLALLQAQGISVPPFFCIGAEETISNDLIRERLVQTFGTLEEEYLFSVRSSATCEDMGSLSFAGQFKSFLNVCRSDLPEKIIACRESLHNANVREYIRKANENTLINTNAELDALKMNVIVQRMIAADYAGVGFSSNPAGLLNETVIVCGEGTGDKVVEDKTPTTTYYYNKTDKKYYFEECFKRIELPEAIVLELVEIMERTAQLLGEPVDVEFALENKKLWILQARPITTIGKAPKLTILDNSNIVESYPHITLPLTDSFINQVYNLIFRNLVMRSTASKNIVHKNEKVFREMLGSVNGRIYYRISNWYTLLQYLPFYKKIIPIWQEMMGVSHQELGINCKRDTTLIQRIRINLNALYALFTVSKQMDRLNRNFSALEEYFNANYQEQMSNTELEKLYKGLLNRVFADWDITLLNDLYAFIFTGLLKKSLRALGFSDADLIRCISGMSNIESLKPIKELLSISLEISECNIFIEKLEALRNDQDYDQLVKQSSALTEHEQRLVKRIENYLIIYGDRSLEELKLESKTFKESPILLVKKILEYLKDRENLLSYYTRLNREKSPLTANMRGINKGIITYLSNKARRGIRNREISRLNRSRLYGMARKIFLTAGENLFNRGLIANPSDVFYLTIHQVFGEKGKGEEVDYHALVAERKNNYEMYAKLPGYSRLVFAGEPFNKVHSNINRHQTNFAEHCKIGTPCSSGEVVGEALVIDSPSFQEDVKGKILITKMTDPGWVFLLAAAKGIVSEMGSLLSHTAIVSRELNIPSVVGVKNITTIVKTGDVIRVNGGTGQVEILKRRGGKYSVEEEQR